jgi:Bacterial regulatory proteins, lacI family
MPQCGLPTGTTRFGPDFRANHRPAIPFRWPETAICHLNDCPMNERPPHLPESVRPTLKTIAEATGFAVATVSRALKDAPDIGEETKRRVREAAERLGYRQNRAAVRLRTGKTNVKADLFHRGIPARHRLSHGRHALFPRSGPA